MITTNVYTRVFRIKYAGDCATCFTIENSGRQYLVTARHVVEGIKQSDQIEIYYKRAWHSINCELVGIAHGNIDIAVLALPIQLSPTLPLEATMHNISWGQEVYFLGYPYEMFGEIGDAYPDFPMPFVKRATLSCMTTDPDQKVLFLDGYNNPGFSGGPVVFLTPGSNRFKVAAVVHGYHHEPEPIYEGEEETNLSFKYNTGIIITCSIDYALDLINANPIGFVLS